MHRQTNFVARGTADKLNFIEHDLQQVPSYESFYKDFIIIFRNHSDTEITSLQKS